VRINLHIERLVLDGLPPDTAHRAQVQQAVMRELTALLATGEVRNALRASGNVDRVLAPTIRLAQDAGAVQLGRQIAGAVLRGIVG
jgi:hypothetical protein